MKIVVIGLGYVGLSNAVLLAQHNEVIGVDISQKRVTAVNSRQSPIVDSELSQFLAERDLDFTATNDLSTSLRGASYVIVATPTNYNDETNFFDTSSVEAVIKDVIRQEPNACVVVKSTVPVGFTENISHRLKTNAVIFSPEFLREGQALYDNLNPTRIIVGEISKRAETFASLLAQGAHKTDIPRIFTGASEAEAIKLFANTYLAMRVAFFNELDSYAMANNLNSLEIITGISSDPRIGSHYNNPSFGYGGYCLPKDTKQLRSNFNKLPQNLISAIVDSNDTRMEFIAKEIMKSNPSKIGVHRLAMKNGSDNYREAAILKVIQKIENSQIKVVIYEPQIENTEYHGFRIESNLMKFKNECDLIISNRKSHELRDVEDKLFTRDLFQEN